MGSLVVPHLGDITTLMLNSLWTRDQHTDCTTALNSRLKRSSKQQGITVPPHLESLQPNQTLAITRRH